MFGATTANGQLRMFSLVLGTKCCLETDDIRFTDISEKCSRLPNCVGCSIERVQYVTVVNLNLIRYTHEGQ